MGFVFPLFRGKNGQKLTRQKNKNIHICSHTYFFFKKKTKKASSPPSYKVQNIKTGGSVVLKVLSPT